MIITAPAERRVGIAYSFLRKKITSRLRYGNLPVSLWMMAKCRITDCHRYIVLPHGCKPRRHRYTDKVNDICLLLISDSYMILGKQKIGVLVT
jgi:hypothetical protein